MSADSRLLPELAALDSTRDLIRIPDEQNVPLTARVRRIIDTAAFQRLRRVSQLGLVAQVYPGATHTRFEHALGVYHNALRYLQQLWREPRVRDALTESDATLLIAAALLHDIGHWPFCHPIEDLGLPGLTRHEEAARQIVLGEEIGSLLTSDWELDPHAVVAVLEGRTESDAGRLIQSILSGPIDIDKMDYLERDSRHAGVPYGRNFDKQRLIQSLTLDAAGTGLAITSKGRTAAELMVFARYVMFSEVYSHHAVRSATAMLTRAFLELHDRLPLDTLLTMGDAELIEAMRTAASGTEVATLVEGCVGGGRRLYKRLFEFSREDNEATYDRLTRLPARDLVSLASRMAHVTGQREPFALILDVPSPHREIEFDIEVHATKSAAPVRSLREVSPVVDALAGSQFTDAVKRVRLFAAPGVRDTLDPTIDWLETLHSCFLSR